jgi:hypothetical protein
MNRTISLQAVGHARRFLCELANIMRNNYLHKAVHLQAH